MTDIITITLTHPDSSGIACDGDEHRNAILHTPGPDCQLVHGLRISYRVCSVCGQDWGEGAYSQHERCELLHRDGTRTRSTVFVYLDNGLRLTYR